MITTRVKMMSRSVALCLGLILLAGCDSVLEVERLIALICAMNAIGMSLRTQDTNTGAGTSGPAEESATPLRRKPKGRYDRCNQGLVDCVFDCYTRFEKGSSEEGKCLGFCNSSYRSCMGPKAK